jgi:molybdenum cofactor biosynthesis enzyme MoaA
MGGGFCVLPWIHLSVSTDGVWGRCCMDATVEHAYYGRPERPTMTLDDGALGCLANSEFAQDNPDRVQSITEAFNSEALRATRLRMLAGDRDDACRHCFVREDAGGRSYRQEMNARYADEETRRRIVAETEADGRVDATPWYLDLRLGNTCNLRCVMCGFPASSRWAAPEGDRWHKAHIDPYGDELDAEIRGLAGSLRRIYFAGGEPFLQRGHRLVLDALIDEGVSGQVDLVYNTNLSFWPERTVAKLREFRSVGIGASCDGTGATFEAIRVGGTWSRFVTNLQAARSERFDVWLQVAPQRGNMWNIQELLEWARSEDLPVNLSNVVETPTELSIRAAPRAERQHFCVTLRALAAEHTALSEQIATLERYASTP